MFSPSGERLASGDDRGHVRLWRMEAMRQGARRVGRSTANLVGHNGSITALRFTPDGKRLVTASGDHTCGQWDLATGEEQRQLVLKHPEWVSSLDLSADGKLALTTCDDGSARLWRLADATHACGHEVGRQAVQFGRLLARRQHGGAHLVGRQGRAAVESFAGDRGHCRRCRPGRCDRSCCSISTQLGGEVWAAMFAPDGQHVLTIGGNDAEMWDLDTRKPVVRYSPHGAVASAAVSPDGKLVATGSWDHSAKIWDVATGRAIRKLEGGHTGYINSVEFSPDGSELLTASDDGTARLWDVAIRQADARSCSRPHGRVLSATFSPDGTRVLTVSGDKTAVIWDRATGKPLRPPLKGHEWAVLCGQFSADGKRIITGSQDKTAIIWDADTGEKLVTLQGHTAAVTSVAFSPDGTRVLTGSQDNTAKLWDADDRQGNPLAARPHAGSHVGELLAGRPQRAHLQPRRHSHHLAGQRMAKERARSHSGAIIGVAGVEARRAPSTFMTGGSLRSTPTTHHEAR